MENNTEINIEKPAKPYFRRMLPTITDGLTLMFVVLYAIYFFSKHHSDSTNYLTFIIILLPVTYVVTWYFFTYIPAQYGITKIYTKDDHIYITASYRDEEPEEKEYYYKDIQVSFNRGRYGSFYIRFKTIPDGSVGNFKTKYTIRNQAGWPRKEAEQLVYDLKAWKEDLSGSNE